MSVRKGGLSLNNDALNVLIRLYGASAAKTIITDSSLAVLWTSCESLPDKLNADMFSRNNAYKDNYALFPIKSEQLLYFSDGYAGYSARVTPMAKDGLIVISLFEPMDILRNSVFSSSAAGIQNSFAQIREAVTQIYSMHIMLKEKTCENEEELYPIFKKLDNSCYRVLGALANYTELFSYAQSAGKDAVFDAASYTKELCYLCDSVLREQNISIICEADSPAYIYCSSDRFAVALLNLIANGISYNISEEKSVKITVRVQGDEVLLSVYDNGLGISASDIERSAVPFGTGRLYEGGSGLGLSIVREFARSCSAKFSISSGANSGTGVHLRFPLANDGGAQLRSPIKESLGSAFSPVNLYLSKFTQK